MKSRNVTDGVVESIATKWEAETLFAVRDRLTDLVHDQGFEDLRSLVEDAIENAQDRLIKYPVLEQAEYARALGFLSGLKMLMEIPEGIFAAAKARERDIERAAEESEAEERTS